MAAWIHLNLGCFAVILNGAPEQYILEIEQLPTTGQENKIATVYAAQDIMSHYKPPFIYGQKKS